MLVLGLAVPASLMAHGGGVPAGGGMMGGAGMLVVADDGSLLVTEMGMGMMGGPGGGEGLDRELVNISADGVERWRASFDEGWPMMPVTDGDLVVLTLASDWWMGADGFGDGGWGTGGGRHDPGTGGHTDDSLTLVALDLTTGAERWRLDLEGDMGSMAQFSPDGSRIFITLREMGEGGGPGASPIGQGQSPGGGSLMSTAVAAIDRDGQLLWTLDLAGGAMGGGR